MQQIHKTKTKLIELFRQIKDMTEPLCSTECRCPRSCCSSEYCEMAKDIAKELWNTDILPLQTNHPTLPFMGEKGCVLPPHFRPLCTYHVCSINAFGFSPTPSFNNEKYFTLRAQCEKLLNKLARQILQS